MSGSRPLKKCLSNWIVVQLICLIAVVVSAQSSAFGQTNALPIEEWDQTAKFAVEQLADPETPSIDLEDLRADLSEQRTAALEVQDGLSARVQTLEAELTTLGEEPAEGIAEAPEIAKRRADLNEQIAQAKVPLLEAQSAYERADGLIREIDDVVRGRLSAELTSLGPSPLNPRFWPRAAEDLTGAVETSYSTVRGTLDSEYLRAQWLGRIPFATLLLVVGLVLQFVVRPRMSRASQADGPAPDGHHDFGRIAQSVVLNLVPAFAAIAIIIGLLQLDPGPDPTAGLGQMLFMAALTVLSAYWISKAVFSPKDPGHGIIPMTERQARGASRNARLMGLVLALMILVRFLSGQFSFDTATLSILLAPLFVLGGFFLARFSLSLRYQEDLSDAEGDEGDAPQARAGIRDALSRIGLIVAVVAPVLALIGYLSAATALFAPTGYTLALLGAFVAIYARFRDALDAWLVSSTDETLRTYRSRFRAIPLILGLLLACLAVPLLALVWGARVSEIEEVWVWLRDGVTIGDVRLSVTDLLTFILVFAIGYTITRMVQAVVKGSVLPRTSLDRGAANAIVSGIGYVGVFLSAVIAISATGLNLGNLAIVAGALSVGIGFGLQTIVSNFVSGIILLVERPIKEGDWIEVAGFSGYVRKISVRSTLIDTFDKASVIVPNSELIAGTVLNWTHSELTGRVIVPVGVAYGEDPRKVEKILREIAEGHPMVLRRPGPSVVFQGFGADSMDFEIRAFLRDVNWMLTVKSEMNFKIVERFAEEGIEIPYAQRDINLRNVDEAAQAFWKGKADSEA